MLCRDTLLLTWDPCSEESGAIGGGFGWKMGYVELFKGVPGVQLIYYWTCLTYSVGELAVEFQVSSGLKKLSTREPDLSRKKDTTRQDILKLVLNRELRTTVLTPQQYIYFYRQHRDKSLLGPLCESTSTPWSYSLPIARLEYVRLRQNEKQKQ